MNGFSRKFSRIEDGFSQARRLPRLGKIRLGLKKIAASGKEYPVETEYFVCPDEVQAVYGKEPKELDVMLPLNDPTIVFPQQLAWYGKGAGLKCHGNKQQAERYDETKKEWFAMACPCPMLKSDENPKGECTEQADLLVILPKVNMGGIYQITTRSYNSAVDINSGLDYTQALIGRIAMVPLKLRRVERITHYDDPKKGRVSRKHFTMTIGLEATVQGLNALRENTQRVIENARLLAVELPAPVMENPEDTPVDTEDVVPEAAQWIGQPATSLLPSKEDQGALNKATAQALDRLPTKPDAEPQPGLPGITPTTPDRVHPPVEIAPDTEIAILVGCMKTSQAGEDDLRRILKNYGLANSRVIPDNEETLTFYLEELRKAVDKLESKPEQVPVDDL